MGEGTRTLFFVRECQLHLTYSRESASMSGRLDILNTHAIICTCKQL